MQTGNLGRRGAVREPISVIQICPGNADDSSSMGFVRRQAQDLRDNGVIVHEVFIEDRQSVRGILKARAEVRAAIKKYRPRIIHAQYGTVTALVGVLSGFRPMVVTFRGSDLNPDGTSSKLKIALKLLMSQLGALFSSRVITVSTQLTNRLWWKKKSALVIPSGVDLKKFFPIDRTVAREHVGWNSDDIVIFFNSGWNSKNKRLDLAMEVADYVKRIIPKARLLVLHGKTDPVEIPWLMNASDVLLMLSDQEGSPNVVKEALACNLPVISVDVGDVANRIINVSNCAVVDRDRNAIGDAVIACLQSRQRSDGRKHAESFSSHVSVIKLLEVYESILESGIE